MSQRAKAPLGSGLSFPHPWMMRISISLCWEESTFFFNLVIWNYSRLLFNPGYPMNNFSPHSLYLRRNSSVHILQKDGANVGLIERGVPHIDSSLIKILFSTISHWTSGISSILRSMLPTPCYREPTFTAFMTPPPISYRKIGFDLVTRRYGLGFHNSEVMSY